MKPAICLVMIVRNEAAVIERCLSSAMPFIDRWCIVDTGSTDDTQDKILSTMADKPGTLLERPWRNFGHNRTEALQLARKLCKPGDYLLMLDADDVIVAPTSFTWPTLTEDGYEIQLAQTSKTNSLRWWRTQLFRVNKPWKYVGPIHEVAVGGRSTKQIHKLYIRTYNDSVRNRKGPMKLLDDAALLEQRLVEKPTDARSVFYLAQCYNNAAMPEEALERYMQRIEMKGFDEEVWYSVYQVGKLYDRLEDRPKAAEYLLRAYNMRPNRAEPLRALANLYLRQHKWAMAALYASAAMTMVPPNDRLFIEPDAYKKHMEETYKAAARNLGRQVSLPANGAEPSKPDRIAPAQFLGKKRLAKGDLPPAPDVTVSVAVRNTPKHLLERAVNSILDQTYPHIFVVVTSDGEETPSWKGCSFVGHPRVLCWATTENRGPYFAHELVRRCSNTPLFAVQDADDWSDRHRIQRCIAALWKHNADAGVPSTYHRFLDGSEIELAPFRDHHGQLPHLCDQFFVVRTAAIEEIGGYYCGTRVGTDTLISALLADLGKLVAVPNATYHSEARRGSLTDATETGRESVEREQATRGMEKIYQQRRLGLDVVRLAFEAEAWRPVFREHEAKLKKLLRERESLAPNVTNSAGTLVIMPSIPERRISAAQNIRNFIRQGAFVRVYLNGYSAVPDEFPKDGVEYIVNSRRRGPALRFSHKAEGFSFVLSVDDDLIYPSDYVKKVTTLLAEYGEDTALGWHGVLWPSGFTFYNVKREVIFYSAAIKTPTQVQMIGSGTACLHASTFNQIACDENLPLFEFEDDVWLSAILASKRVKLVRPPSEQDWMISNETGPTLWRNAVDNGFQRRHQLVKEAFRIFGWSL